MSVRPWRREDQASPVLHLFRTICTPQVQQSSRCLQPSSLRLVPGSTLQVLPTSGPLSLGLLVVLVVKAGLRGPAGWDWLPTHLYSRVRTVSMRVSQVSRPHNVSDARDQGVSCLDILNNSSISGCHFQGSDTLLVPSQINECHKSSLSMLGQMSEAGSAREGGGVSAWRTWRRGLRFPPLFHSG